MRMNRRNVLVGLGTIVAGGGAALGTGAFSRVEATRNVEVDTNGDGDAQISFKILNELLQGGSNDVIEFSPDNDLNENAITQFDNAFEIGNNTNADGESIPVKVQIEKEEDGSSLLTEDVESGTGMLFEFESGSDEGVVVDGDGVVLPADTTATFNIVFNIEDGSNLPDEITIIANNNE